MTKKIDCVIPFYNERERLIKTVTEILKTDSIDRVICVNDGSTDDYDYRQVEELNKYLDKNTDKKFDNHSDNHSERVLLVGYTKNRGKSLAVKYGLDFVQTEDVLMLDADLQELDFMEIQAGINKYFKNKADLLIFNLVKVEPYFKLLGGDIAYSGQRIIKTKILKDILTPYLSCYQIEPAINNEIIKRKLKVTFSPLSVRNCMKHQKVGVLEGLKKEAEMIKQITSYPGNTNHLTQFTYLGFNYLNDNLKFEVISERIAAPAKKKLANVAQGLERAFHKR